MKLNSSLPSPLYQAAYPGVPESGSPTVLKAKSSIKSPSKSSGHILTGISADSKVVLVHSILPIKRYLPGSESIGLYVSSVLLCSQVEEVSLKYSHRKLSNTLRSSYFLTASTSIKSVTITESRWKSTVASLA